MIENANLGGAIEALHDGKKMTRTGWNGKGQFIKLQPADTNTNPMNQAFVYISTVDGKLIPWVASQSDLLAHDWCEVA